MSGVRYVDLGLGTHRVKCRIHPKFRLVLIAEDAEVHEKFPIPLINRLEKHYLGMETMLTEGDSTRGLPDGPSFKPKILIWVNFEGTCNGRFWYIL
jgi:hypothetical protein